MIVCQKHQCVKMLSAPTHIEPNISQKRHTYNDTFPSFDVSHKSSGVGLLVHIQFFRIADESNINIIASRKLLQCVTKPVGTKDLVLVGCNHGDLSKVKRG